MVNLFSWWRGSAVLVAGLLMASVLLLAAAPAGAQRQRASAVNGTWEGDFVTSQGNIWGTVSMELRATSRTSNSFRGTAHIDVADGGHVHASVTGTVSGSGQLRMTIKSGRNRVDAQARVSGEEMRSGSWTSNFRYRGTFRLDRIG